MERVNSKKIYIVTGANGIIGSAFCKKALTKGFCIAAFDLLNNQLDLLKENYPDQLLIHSCDVRKKTDIEQGLSKVLEKWNKVDGLFNNAAWKTENPRDFFKPFEDWHVDTWREILSVNLDGAMLVDQVVGSHMANRQQFGSIVHTASIYGIVAPDQRIYEGSTYLGGEINSPAVYSASKGAIISLTKYLAAYWGNKGVRVNAVSPGGVESGQNDIFIKKYTDRVPCGRMAKVTEIIEGALFLLSDEASYINGHNLVIDGGLTIW